MWHAWRNFLQSIELPQWWSDLNFDFGLQIGRGTYSNVYKAREKGTGKIVALKKVRFDTSDSESIKFMAREIMILQMLDHPNVIKLKGLATSRMQYSLYLVFDFMQSDLTRIISRPGEKLTEAQVGFLSDFLNSYYLRIWDVCIGDLASTLIWSSK